MRIGERPNILRIYIENPFSMSFWEGSDVGHSGIGICNVKYMLDMLKIVNTLGKLDLVVSSRFNILCIKFSNYIDH